MFNLCFAEALSDGLPVDDIPDGIKVLCLAVLVLQVVGVLPGVNAEQRDERSSDGVLVGARHQAQRAALLVLDQPCPAAALNPSQSRICLLPERVKGTEIGVDGVLFERS